MQYKEIAVGGIVYFWFAANTTAGSAGDGATPLYDVRLAGASSSAAPTASGSPTLLSHANYPDGAHEIAIDTTGYATGEYAVFSTLTISSVNPVGLVGSFVVKAAASTSYDLLAAIKAKTDNLPSDPADASVVAGLIAGVETKVDTVDTVVDAIKLKTDNLPSDPADASVVAGLIAGVETKVDTVDTVVDAIKLKTDNLPSDPADASVIAGRFDTVDTNIAAVNAKTTNLPSDPADQSLIMGAIATVQTSVDDIPTGGEMIALFAAADDATLAAIAALSTLVNDLPTNAEMAALLASADDAVLAQIALVKAVTDLFVASDAEPTGVPAATATPLVKLAWLFSALRNQIKISATKKTFHNSSSVPQWEKDLSDSGAEYTETGANAI